MGNGKYVQIWCNDIKLRTFGGSMRDLQHMLEDDYGFDLKKGKGIRMDTCSLRQLSNIKEQYQSGMRKAGIDDIKEAKFTLKVIRKPFKSVLQEITLPHEAFLNYEKHCYDFIGSHQNNEESKKLYVLVKMSKDYESVSAIMGLLAYSETYADYIMSTIIPKEQTRYYYIKVYVDSYIDIPTWMSGRVVCPLLAISYRKGFIDDGVFCGGLFDINHKKEAYAKMVKEMKERQYDTFKAIDIPYILYAPSIYFKLMEKKS